ncbi:hypothetical protein FB451DRAFT_1193835 [Mycena latifolia]|nr:hypothetical protein FB451DRAFT_1193835 [Mycena latifolia]
MVHLQHRPRGLSIGNSVARLVHWGKASSAVGVYTTNTHTHSFSALHAGSTPTRNRPAYHTSLRSISVLHLVTPPRGRMQLPSGSNFLHTVAPRSLSQRVQLMELKGVDAEEETRLCLRLKDQKWFLNENIMAPECNGVLDNDNDTEDKDKSPEPKCNTCLAFYGHVGEDFAAGEGSLKLSYNTQVWEIHELEDEIDAIDPKRHRKKSWGDSASQDKG